MSNYLLDAALLLAIKAHAGQKDKGGQPYILHPLRVMLSMETDDERLVALLHDVFEDSPTPLSALERQGFPQHIIDAVVALTRNDGEDYFNYIERVGSNPLARAVKMADLADNMDITRLPRLSNEDFLRLKRYARAKRALEYCDGVIAMV